MTVSAPTRPRGSPSGKTRLSVKQALLNAGLDTVARIAPSKAEAPAIQCVLLSSSGGKLSLSATDLELTLHQTVEAAGDDMAFLVPAKQLAGLVESFPGTETITLEYDPKVRRVAVSCGGARASLSTLDADDFPPVPKVSGDKIVLDGKALAEAIDCTLHAVAADENRGVLASMLWRLEGSSLKVCATDSFHLAQAIIPLKDEQQVRQDLLLRKRAIVEARRLLPGDGELLLSVSDSRSHAMLEVGAAKLVVNVLAGAFPKFEQVLPTTSKTVITCRSVDLLRATMQASLVAGSPKESAVLYLTAEKGKQLFLKAEAPDGAYAAQIDCDMTGEDLSWSMNAHFTHDAIDALDCDKVAIYCNGSAMPFILREPGRNDWLQLVMPMHSPRRPEP